MGSIEGARVEFCVVTDGKEVDDSFKIVEITGFSVTTRVGSFVALFGLIDGLSVVLMLEVVGKDTGFIEGVSVALIISGVSSGDDVSLFAEGTDVVSELVLFSDGDMVGRNVGYGVIATIDVQLQLGMAVAVAL